MRSSRLKDRKNRRKQKPAMLNLVALMDIFTILVFFLMVNSSEVEILETSSNIKLPDSVAQQRPEQRIVISINADDVILQGRTVASVKDILLTSEMNIESLHRELILLAQHEKDKDKDFTGAVTILGASTLPYELLKRIMRTCQLAEFTQIALAVNQIGREAA